MERALLALLLLLAAATAAQAQGSAVMAVSVTVVNTCFFGPEARCARPDTSLSQATERQVHAASGTVRQRIVHL